MGKKRGAGRGRAIAEERPLDGALLVPLARIRAASAQPRRWFEMGPLDNLAGSIRERGIIQPLRVRPDPAAPGCYILVVGERRLRAAALAGLAEVPVIICERSPEEALLDALAENIARVDLSSGEFVEAYRLLRDRGQSHRRIAAGVGVAHTTIGRFLRLADDALLSRAVEAGRVARSVAWELLSLDEPTKRAILDELAVADGRVARARVRALIESFRGFPTVSPAPGGDAAAVAPIGARGAPIPGATPMGGAVDAGGDRDDEAGARAAGRARALRRTVEHQLATLAPFAREPLVVEDLRAILAMLLDLYPESAPGSFDRL